MSYPEKGEEKIPNKIKRTVFPFCSCWKYNSYSHDFIYVFKISIRYICAYLCVYSKDHLITCFVYNSHFLDFTFHLHVRFPLFWFRFNVYFFAAQLMIDFFLEFLAFAWVWPSFIHSYVHLFLCTFHFTLLFIAYSFIFNTLTYISYM